MASIDMPFSENKHDQKCLAGAGGSIVIKPDERPVFRFNSQEQYKLFLDLQNYGR